MKSKKFLILAITISFPVILYLFLRFFGQNNYDLPYFFQNEATQCLTAEGNPIYLNSVNENDSVSLQALSGKSLSLLIFPNVAKDNQPLINELSRTLQNLGSKVVLDLLAIYPDIVNSNNLLSIDETTIENYSVSGELLGQLINCQFKLPNNAFQGIHPTEEVWPNEEIIVLMDQSNNIRGYYNGFETKEVDRLILEINVLLSKN